MKPGKQRYSLYKKLIKIPLEKQITDTKEFVTLAENFPHMTESLRLKRELQRLKQTLKSTEDRATRLQRKREINLIRARLKQERIWKQLHGESKQESLFRIRYKLDVVKEAVTSAPKRARKTLTSVRARQTRLMRRLLPPSIFDLNSLLVSERGSALKEWIRKRQSKLDKP